MSTVYYDNINGFSQLKMKNGKLYGRLNSGEWQEIETGGGQGEPGAPGADGVSSYVYWAWCADPATGAGFSLTDPADYISFITRNTVLVSPQFSDFTVWVKYVGSNGKNGADGVSTYVYYAYASDEDGTNFSLSPADNLIYQAILVTHTEIASPSLSDFAGMFYQYKAEKTELDLLQPTGTVIAFAGNSAPTGYLICNGAAVNRTTYAKLFAVIGTTYGAGDGSTTFNLPNLTDKFIMGSGTAGTSKDAGLPNITGYFQQPNKSIGMWETYGSVSGAFGSRESTSITERYSKQAYTSSGSWIGVNIDASRSSSIYGKSTTVQPPALTMRFYIKY